MLRLHGTADQLRCPICFKQEANVDAHELVVRAGARLARTAWALLRAVTYLAAAIWSARQGGASPLAALLSGVFVGDMISRLLLMLLELPFHGPSFAAEFALYAVLAGVLLRGGAPFAQDGQLMAFAALGFLVTFGLKCMRWIWTRLLRDA